MKVLVLIALMIVVTTGAVVNAKSGNLVIMSFCSFCLGAGFIGLLGELYK